MSEQVLNQILGKLNQIDSRIDRIDSRMDQLDGRMDRLESEVKAIKADTADLPLIRQAVLETNKTVKQIEAAQKSFERYATNELNTHSHSIDIINRRQLKLEAEFEQLKSK